MKPKLILSIILILGSLYRTLAQPDLSYTQMADTLLYLLDKSFISTGILYDRVYPFASLHDFNNNRADTSNYLHFMQAHGELYQAAYNKTGFITNGYLDTLIKAIK